VRKDLRLQKLATLTKTSCENIDTQMQVLLAKEILREIVVDFTHWSNLRWRWQQQQHLVMPNLTPKIPEFGQANPGISGVKKDARIPR